MQEFEAALGLRLLDRNTRRLSPTEAGRRPHARLAPLLSEPDTALREAADLPRPAARLRRAGQGHRLVAHLRAALAPVEAG